MSVHIVGISAKEGVFEGKAYNNVTFQCTEPYEQGRGMGVRVRTYWIKRKTLNEIFGKDLSDKELAGFIGQTAEFFFNEYQQVKYIEIQQPQK